MHILQAQCCSRRHQAFADVVSSPEKSQTDAKPAMLIEENACFQFFISAYQYRGTPSVCHSVCCDKVFRLRRQIIFLSTAPTEFTNLRKVCVQLSIADNHLRSLWPVNKCGPDSGTRIRQYSRAKHLRTTINQTAWTHVVSPDIWGYRTMNKCVCSSGIGSNILQRNSNSTSVFPVKTPPTLFALFFK